MTDSKKSYSNSKYYITKETVIEVGLTLKQAKEKVKKSKVSGILHIRVETS
jgi:hypothetical protein